MKALYPQSQILKPIWILQVVKIVVIKGWNVTLVLHGGDN